MNKNETDRLIESLGEDCKIGDVLGKMKEKYFKTWNLVKSDELLYLWADCGLTRSFQEIVESSGWEIGHFGEERKGVLVKTWVEQLKDPNARALAEFLNSIFTKTSKK